MKRLIHILLTISIFIAIQHKSLSQDTVKGGKPIYNSGSWRTITSDNSYIHYGALGQPVSGTQLSNNSYRYFSGFFSVRPNMDILRINLAREYNFCHGDTNMIGGKNIVIGGKPPYKYKWSPSTGLNNDTIPNPFAFPNNTTEYTLTVVDKFEKSDSIKIIVNVNPLPKSFQVDFGNEKIFESVPVLFKIINAEAGVVYNFESQGAIVEKQSETSANLTWSTIGTKPVTITAKKGECTRVKSDIEVEVFELQSSIEISLDKTEAEPGENITVTVKPGLPDGFRDTITVSYSKYELFSNNQTVLNDDAVISVPIVGNISKDNQLLVLVGKMDNVEISGISKRNIPITSKTLKINPVNIAGKEFRLRHDNSKINISPNPAENTATIIISNLDIGNAELKIVNSLGIALETRTIEIKSRTEQEELLDLSNFESGVYTLILISGEGLEIENFVVIK